MTSRICHLALEDRVEQFQVSLNRKVPAPNHAAYQCSLLLDEIGWMRHLEHVFRDVRYGQHADEWNIIHVPPPQPSHLAEKPYPTDIEINLRKWQDAHRRLAGKKSTVRQVYSASTKRIARETACTVCRLPIREVCFFRARYSNGRHQVQDQFWSLEPICSVCTPECYSHVCLMRAALRYNVRVAVRVREESAVNLHFHLCEHYRQHPELYLTSRVEQWWKMAHSDDCGRVSSGGI